MAEWIKIECCGCCTDTHYVCPVCHVDSFEHEGVEEKRGFHEPEPSPCVSEA